MSVRKRVSSNASGEHTAWEVDYRDNAGKRRVKGGFATKKAARDWAAQTHQEVMRGIHTPASQSITVSEAGDLWIEQGELGADGEPPLEAATLHQYRSHLKHHIKPFLGAVKLHELTQGAVTQYRTDLLKADKPRSHAMVRKIMTSLGSIIAVAQDHGRVSHNVVRDLNSRRKRRGARHVRRLEVGVDIPNKDELRAMLGITGRWRPLIVTLIFTGLRASELRGLFWNDVDFEAGVIHVRQRADRYNEMGPPKSAASRRDVPMTPMVANTLKTWKLECPPGALNLVFPNGNGNIENLSNIYRRGLGWAQVEAGIVDAPGEGKDPKPKYGLHAFRHSAASLFIEQGFGPKYIQTIMGHSSIQMTFDTYGHLFPSPDEDANAIKEMEARLVGR